MPAPIAESAFHSFPELPALRRVRPELMHVTLAFLGQTPEARLEDVRAAVEETARRAKAFDIELDHIGRFPSGGMPRFVWLGIGAGAPAVLALGAALRTELDRREIPYDVKPLRAHVTLARVRDGITRVEARAIAAAVEAIRLPHLRFRAEAAVVFQSVLSPRGPKYTPLAVLPLRAGTQA